MATRIINRPSIKVEVKDGKYKPFIFDNGKKRYLCDSDEPEPVPPVPTDRILYTVVEGGHKPESTWITNNCSENVFDESTGEGYLVLNENVTTIECPAGEGTYPNMFDDSGEDSNIATVVIPTQITTIGEDAFSVCTGLIYVTIPNSIISIGDYAFNNCSGLTSVTIPNSVTSIGSYAFEDCSGLITVNFNATNCISMGSIVWSGCSSLSTLNIGENVTNIPDYAFSGCTGLSTVNYDASNCAQFGNNNGITGNANITTLTIGENVQTIPSSAFSGCSGLTGALTIPNSVTSIGEGAFSNCENFGEELIINENITYLGYGAFSGCNGIKKVIYNAKRCEFAGNDEDPVFGFESNIETAIIGDKVEIITNGLFNNCSKLNSVTFNNSNSLKKIDEFAFYGCSGLASIDIPDSVTEIGYAAFYGSGLNGHLTLPNYLIIIESGGEWYGAFGECHALTSITIPDSVKSIGTYAFFYCDKLTSVTCLATNPPTLGTGNFTASNDTLYVPAESVQAYLDDTKWNTAFNGNIQAIQE